LELDYSASREKLWEKPGSGVGVDLRCVRGKLLKTKGKFKLRIKRPHHSADVWELRFSAACSGAAMEYGGGGKVNDCGEEATSDFIIVTLSKRGGIAVSDGWTFPSF